MSENPFKIIRPTDQPPADLRKNVMGSVKIVMLLIRFLQLFIADYSAAVFDNVRLVARKDNASSNGTPDTDPKPH